jgi:hypothetical protein
LIRFRYTVKGYFSNDFSYAIDKSQSHGYNILEIKEEKNHYKISTNKVYVIIQKHDLRIGIYELNGQPILEDEKGFQLDWNKLIYNDDQITEFNLQKHEKMIQPDKYEYLFENPTQRSPLELFYLKMAGYDVDEFVNDDINEDNNESIVKRLIIQDILTSC